MSKFDRLMEAAANGPGGRSSGREEVEPEQKRGPGRPKGKRSSGTHRPMTHFLDMGLYEQCLRELREDMLKPDFSEFLNTCMSNWLTDRQAKKLDKRNVDSAA